MRRTIVGFALGIAAAASILSAQDTSVVAPGDPVRISAPSRGMRHWDGYFIGFRRDSLVLWNAKHDTSVAVVPFSAVESFQVNHGDRPPRSQAKLGLIAGTAIGLGTGVASTILYSCDGNEWLCDDAHVIVFFTLFGALVGTVTGALNPAPPYETVKLQPSLSVAPLSGGRVGVGLQLRVQP